MSAFKSLARSVRNKIALALDPLRYRQEVLRRSADASLQEKVLFDALPRPHFGYGVLRAAEQAKALGMPRISVIEFGCAGGNGLVELENVAELVEAEVGTRVDVYGFDIGEGLPRPLDYRDLPYAWKAGQFKMDVPRLKSRLTRARLIIGDVADTVDSFIADSELAPIGFVSFDMDYYTSTIAAFRIFGGGYEHLLPRVYCYFDDCIGPDHELHCEYVGELLAIKEFNEASAIQKIAPIHGFHYKRVFPAAWNAAMFICHSFEHPEYGRYIETKVDMALALED